jgi:hydrogenase maturation protein HypF
VNTAPAAPALHTQLLPTEAPRRVLAVGAWLKNTACLLHGAHARWSPLHGDLAEPAQCAALEVSLKALLSEAQAQGQPIEAIAHDLHPDFFSTQLAHHWARELGVPAIGVQHHHAHIAALQAEHGIQGPVIGLALDGVGLGTDGVAWGGELLWVDGAQWSRLGHLTPLRLAGGDVAAREPWRLAAATLHALGRIDEAPARLGRYHSEAGLKLIGSMLDKGLNSPWATGAGRWFDAAAGILGLGERQAFEAQAAIALEKAATAWLADHTVITQAEDTPIRPSGELDLLPLMARLWAMDPATQQGQGAARFHVSLADGLARWATQAAWRRSVDHIVLGGGCFCNRLLTQRLLDGIARLCRDAGRPPLRVLQAQALSCGDAGLALGQAWAVSQAADLNVTQLDPTPQGAC